MLKAKALAYLLAILTFSAQGDEVLEISLTTWQPFISFPRYVLPSFASDTTVLVPRNYLRALRRARVPIEESAKDALDAAALGANVHDISTETKHPQSLVFALGFGPDGEPDSMTVALVGYLKQLDLNPYVLPVGVIHLLREKDLSSLVDILIYRFDHIFVSNSAMDPLSNLVLARMSEGVPSQLHRFHVGIKCDDILDSKQLGM